MWKNLVTIFLLVATIAIILVVTSPKAIPVFREVVSDIEGYQIYAVKDSKKQITDQYLQSVLENYMILGVYVALPKEDLNHIETTYFSFRKDKSIKQNLQTYREQLIKELANHGRKQQSNQIALSGYSIQTIVMELSPEELNQVKKYFSEIKRYQI